MTSLSRLFDRWQDRTHEHGHGFRRIDEELRRWAQYWYSPSLAYRSFWRPF